MAVIQFVVVSMFAALYLSEAFYLDRRNNDHAPFPYFSSTVTIASILAVTYAIYW